MSLDQLQTTADRKQFTELFLEQLNDPFLRKNAIDNSRGFTKRRLRGEGLFRQILPQETITADDLDEQLDTDHPARIEYMEPDVIAGRNIPFDGMPNVSKIQGPRYVITFSKVQSPLMAESTIRLMAYGYDIRAVIGDQLAKDLLDVEDVMFFEEVNSLMGAPDTPSPMTEDLHWRTMYGGWTNDTIQEAFKVLGQCTGKWDPETAIINHTSRRDFHKWTHNEWGGEIASDILRKGFTAETFPEIKFHTTIKDHIVPNGTMFMFGPPEAIGKSYVLQDLVMNVERKREYISWDCYSIIGAGIGNPTFARVDIG